MSSNQVPLVGREEGEVVVRGDASGFAQQIMAGRHRLATDEPAAAGGTDSGPTPYDLLLAARLRHSRIHAVDCENCETKEGRLDRIDVAIEITGELSEEQRKRLVEIAEKCPVHRTLTSEVDIRTRIA